MLVKTFQKLLEDYLRASHVVPSHLFLDPARASIATPPFPLFVFGQCRNVGAHMLIVFIGGAEVFSARKDLCFAPDASDSVAVWANHSTVVAEDVDIEASSPALSHSALLVGAVPSKFGVYRVLSGPFQVLVEKGLVCRIIGCKSIFDVLSGESGASFFVATGKWES